MSVHYFLPYTINMFLQSSMLLNRCPSHEYTNVDEDPDRLLCRFVINGTGKRIGESIGINGDILIIKSGARFLGVPLKHIEEQETMLLVKGLVDLKKAYELGDQWQSNSTSEITEGEEDG